MARQVTLVVEDGSIVAGANSFVSEDDIVAYALARGVTLPYSTDEDKDKVAVLGIMAADYLRIMNWRGELVDPAQPMPWPRKNFTGNPQSAEDAIPFAVIEAQKQLTLLANGGTVLIPTWAGTGFLVKEKIGPIENVYSEKVGVSSDGMPLFPGITALLDPWLIGTTEGFVPVLIKSVGGRTDGC